MILFSKLKYYNTLCEKGVINNQQNDLDDLINTLEEKQFEYLKRLETAKDESRKDEINEIINMIDLQLKELAAIKTAVNAGILVDQENEPTQSIDLDNQRQDNETFKSTNDNSTSAVKQNKKRLIIAIVALVAIVTIFVFNSSKNNLYSANNDTASSSVDSANDDEEDNTTTLGLGTFDGPNAQKQMEEQDSWVEGANLSKGLYVYDIANQSLIDGGLQLGDRLLTLNGETVDTNEKCKEVIEKYNPGDEVVLVVSREFNEVTISGKFLKPSEVLEYKSSGEATFEIDGRPFRITYNDDGSIEMSMWKFAEENK